jgi:anti-anti-sigma factor
MLSGPAVAFGIRCRGAYAVLRAEGELDITAVPRLEVWVRQAARRAPRVIVDLRDVDFIDSFALSALIALQEQSDTAPWSLHCIAGPGIQRLLDLAGARDALRWVAPEQLAQ